MYTYSDLEKDILSLKKTEREIIGASTLDKNIYALHKGEGKSRVLIHGAIHAREFLTAKLLIELLKDYDGSFPVTVIPMVNPDGVDLCNLGLDSIYDKERRDYLFSVNGKSSDFTLWKANANAVDLNVNFDAGFGKGKLNLTYPAPENYIGEKPFSERESIALKSITEKNRYSLTVSYHSRGEVLYYGYENIVRYKEQVNKIADKLGYQPLLSKGSHGGYKDWYTLNFSGLGITVETGLDNASYPLSDKVFEKMLKDNKDILAFYAETASEIGKI